MFKPVPNHTKARSFKDNLIESLFKQVQDLEARVRQLEDEIKESKQIPERCDSPAIYGVSSN